MVLCLLCQCQLMVLCLVRVSNHHLLCVQHPFLSPVLCSIPPPSPVGNQATSLSPPIHRFFFGPVLWLGRHRLDQRCGKKIQFLMPLISPFSSSHWLRMKRCVLLCVIGIGITLAAKPNIVFIFADDLDVEMGSTSRNYMPVLNSAIGDAGARFTRFYASTPVCCPSRSALYTGTYQHNNHVTGNELKVPVLCPASSFLLGGGSMMCTMAPNDWSQSKHCAPPPQK